MSVQPDRFLETCFLQASKTYRKANTNRWVSALWCSRVVGRHERGRTLGLASDMGVSVDTIESMAHAYTLFEELCLMDRGEMRQFVFLARRSPYIYLSHFIALYNARERYNLTNQDILKLLMDIVQGEGQISSRDVDRHTRDTFGDSRDWTFYAQRATRNLAELLNQPDLPKEGRKKVEEAFSWLGDHA